MLLAFQIATVVLAIAVLLLWNMYRLARNQTLGFFNLFVLVLLDAESLHAQRHRLFQFLDLFGAQDPERLGIKMYLALSQSAGTKFIHSTKEASDILWQAKLDNRRP